MATELKVPQVGESIAEVEIGDWRKKTGDQVEKDETIVILESEKASVELPAPAAGTLGEILKQKGQTAAIGEVIGYIEPQTGRPTSVDGKGAEPGSKESDSAGRASSPETTARVMPAAQRALAEHGLRAEDVKATGPGGRLLKEDVLRHVESRPAVAPSETIAPAEREPAAERQEKLAESKPAKKEAAGREEEIVPMSRLRRTLAERLVEAQHSAALLTTFNEVDMSEVIALRKQFGEAFLAKYNAKLGFMSFFVKAVVDALKLIPQVNAEVRGTNVVYRNYHDIGVAVGGGKGLVVPVLRNAERLSFAEIEVAINDYAKRARDNKLKVEELQGGTFTISNGGVYGSLLSTPIVNPPQSGILGMHAIQERPVARDGNVVVRPMMYVALTYDHRIVDGREAVTFLKRIKEVIENPTRMLIEV